MIFKFHGKYSPEDKQRFKTSQKEDLIKICKYLNTSINLLQNIKFEVFDTREGKQEADPNHSISRASARYNEMAIYRYWLPADDSHFPHEITHLVAHLWAKPYILEIELDTWDGKKIRKKIEMVSTSFMQEGLAIAVDDIVFNRQLMEDGELKLIDDWCRIQLDKMPLVSECINMEGFCSFENKIVVPFSASFSKFLLKLYGLDKYKQMYTRIKETLPPKQNLQTIEDIYRLREMELLISWRKSLES
jgi:hypothetical protein